MVSSGERRRRDGSRQAKETRNILLPSPPDKEDSGVSIDCGTREESRGEQVPMTTGYPPESLLTFNSLRCCSARQMSYCIC